MQYSKLLYLLSSDTKKADRENYFQGLIDSKRNKTLRMHKDYYDGIHWSIEKNGESNTTRSGKLIWGKHENTYTGAEDDKLARKGRQRNQISFNEGQLQTHNYIKLFTQIYQDFVLGSDDDVIKVEYTGPENTVEIQKELDMMWSNVDSFIKEQVAKMVISTVGVQSLNLVNGQYQVQIEDAEQCAPIYRNGEIVGGLKYYTIDAESAELIYGLKVKEDKAIYVDLVYPLYGDDGQELRFFNTKFVNGVLIGTVEMPDSLQFNIYDFVANIDHPYRKFSEDSLEDSEIFNWIDRNDALNSNETIEFITNQYMAMPKMSIDWDAMEKMKVNPNDEAFKQALENFQYFAGSIDSLPIKLVDGKVIQDSFYKGKETIIESLFEDAGIPRMFVHSKGMANVAAETIKLGLSILTRKISQKRDKAIQLIKRGSIKALKAKDLIEQDLDVRDLPIKVELPSLIDIDIAEMTTTISTAVNTNIIPNQYATELFLETLDKEEDLGRVIAEKQANTEQLRADIVRSRALAKTQIKAEQEQSAKEQNQREVEKINAEIEALS